MKVILFDLDETLILDEAVSQKAFRDAARLAVPNGPALDRLARRAGEVAQRLWEAGPEAPYCKRIGHSAWEGLWARYNQGEHPAIEVLRSWAPGYRTAVWREALALESIPETEGLPEAMAATFLAARHDYPLYPEIEGLLAALRTRGYQLGIVTNGVPDLQREKIDGFGLEHLFDAAVVSGEVDIGKPDRGIFDHICRLLAVAPADCVMVGDNPGRDVAGAMAAGMKSVWVARGHRERDSRYPADLECDDLSAMLPWLDKLEGR